MHVSYFGFLSAPMTFSKTSIILEIGETCRQKHANHFQFDEMDRYKGKE